MTTPDERTRAVMQAKAFLQELCETERFPDVPAEVRRQAHVLLRHYPSAEHLDFAAVAWPQWWAPAGKEASGAPSYKELMSHWRGSQVSS